MNSFREVVYILERRDGRLRGLVYGGWVLATDACLAFLLVLISTCLGRPLPTWAMPLLAGAGLVAAAAAFVVGARARRPRARLLLEVDARLGLDARLSSLLELEERGGPRLFFERLFRDVVRIAPDWRRALRIPRRLPFLAAATVLVMALALTLPLLSPHRTRSGDAGLQPSPSSAFAPAAADSDDASEAGAADDAVASGLTTVDSPPPATPETHTSQRTLGEILSELRPALASSSAAQAPGSDGATDPESEDADAALRQELEKLQDRLEAGGQPSAEDIQTLRDAAASPDLASTIEAAAASSDMDALRQTISQLLSSSAAPSAPTTDSTRSDVQSGDDAESTADATMDSPSPPGAPADDASSGASAATKGDAAPSAAPNETPIFESGVGDVAPVAAPLVVGESGELSSYITSGVPIEQASDASGQGATWILSPGQVQSLLSARDLPAGAAEIIRDYFQRITEETP